MPKGKELAAAYTVGSVGYSILEILWRGFTHWTMTMTGGVCFILIYLIHTRLKQMKLWMRCLLGSGAVTSVEFVVGCIVNRWLNLGVWDYSGQRFHLLGQICPLYSALWFLLCIPASTLAQALKRGIDRCEAMLQQEN